jgi:hypothetical protein
MKVKCLLLLAVLIYSKIYSEEILLYPDSETGSFQIVYNENPPPNQEQFKFMVSSFGRLNADILQVSPGHLKIFQAVLTKYLEWEKIAYDNGVDVNKEIPHEPFVTKVTWKSERFRNNEYTLDGLELSFSVIISANNYARVYGSNRLIITSNTISPPEAMQSGLFKEVYTIGIISLSSGEVEKILNVISDPEQSIKNAKIRAEQKKAEEKAEQSRVDSLFQ